MKNNWKNFQTFKITKLDPNLIKPKKKKKKTYKEPNTYNVKKQPKFYFGFVTVFKYIGTV